MTMSICLHTTHGGGFLRILLVHLTPHANGGNLSPPSRPSDSKRKRRKHVASFSCSACKRTVTNAVNKDLQSSDKHPHVARWLCKLSNIIGCSSDVYLYLFILFLGFQHFHVFFVNNTMARSGCLRRIPCQHLGT